MVDAKIMLKPIQYESKLVIKGVPTEWVPLLQIYDPDIPQHPIKYVHVKIGNTRIYGFPAAINFAKSNSSRKVDLEIFFLSNVDLDSKSNWKQKITSEVEERLGVKQKVDLATLKKCCTDRTDFVKFVEKVWNENLKNMYGDFLPYGKFYEEVYSIARFTAALASPTGGKSEKIMLYNLIKDFGEKVEIKGDWTFLDFFLLPTYTEIMNRSLSDFPKFKDLCVAIDCFGSKFLKKRRSIGRFIIKYSGIILPRSDEDFRKLTAKSFNTQNKKILDRVLDDFNRFPLRAIAFFASIYNINQQNDFAKWKKNDFITAYTGPSLTGLSIKAVGCFLQQGFGNADTVPIDTWVKSFYKSIFNIQDDQSFLTSFSEIGKFERFIWLCSQARKMNANPFFDAMWCIKFGKPGGSAPLRGPNPLSCYECTLRSNCVGYKKIENEIVYVRNGLQNPTDNTFKTCTFVIGTEKSVPKTVFFRKGSKWKLIDEFSGYILHKKINQVKTKMTVSNLISIL